MTQDLYYYESGYIDESYFVYTADAESIITSSSSISCDLTLYIPPATVKEFSADLTCSFTASATITNIHQTDLFAFTDALMEVEVSVLKQTNVNVSTNFSVAITAVRGIYVQAQADAYSQSNIIASVSRGLEAAHSAAFSLTATATKVVEFTSTENSAFSPTVICDVVKNSFAVLDSTSSVTVVSEVLKQAAATITSQVTVTANVNSVSRVIPEPTVVQGGLYGALAVSSTQSKFGGASLKWNQKPGNGYITQGPVYGSAGYLAVRSTEFNLQSVMSTDGVNWTCYDNNSTLVKTPASGTALEAVTLKYINNKYVQTTSGAVTETSTDGINWTSYTATSWPAGNFNDITYLPTSGLYVRVGGASYTSYVYTSTNLTTWTQRIAYYGYVGFYHTFNAVASGGGNTALAVGVATNQDGTGTSQPLTAYTSNGTSWTTLFIHNESTTSNALNDVTYDATYGWIAVGNSGAMFICSVGNSPTVKANWVKQTLGTTTNLQGVAVANGKIVVTGSYNDTVVYGTPGSWTVNTSLGVSSLIVQSGSPTYKHKPTYVNSRWLIPGYTSTDNTATWTPVDYSFNNKAPYLDYGVNSSWANAKSIDFWTYVVPFANASQNYTAVLFLNAGEFDATIVRNGTIGANFTLNLYYGSTGSNYTLATNTWHHIRAVRNDAGNTSVYVNGTRVTANVASTYVTQTQPLYIGDKLAPSYWTTQPTPEYYLEEFKIDNATITDPTATSITVPTAPFINTGTTGLLLHFNDNLLDDATSPLSLSASVSSSFACSITATKTNRITQTLSASSAVSAIAVKTTNTPTAIQASAGLTAGSNRQASASSTIQANGFVVSAFGRIRPEFADLISTSTMTVSYTTAISFTINATASFTSTVNGGRVRIHQAGLQASASVVANNTRRRNLPAAIQASATISPAVNRRVKGAASITTAFSPSMTVRAVRNGQIALYSTFTVSKATGIRVKRSPAALSANFTSYIQQNRWAPRPFGSWTTNINVSNYGNVSDWRKLEVTNLYLTAESGTSGFTETLFTASGHSLQRIYSVGPTRNYLQMDGTVYDISGATPMTGGPAIIKIEATRYNNTIVSINGSSQYVFPAWNESLATSPAVGGATGTRTFTVSGSSPTSSSILSPYTGSFWGNYLLEELSASNIYDGDVNPQSNLVLLKNIYDVNGTPYAKFHLVSMWDSFYDTVSGQGNILASSDAFPLVVMSGLNTYQTFTWTMARTAGAFTVNLSSNNNNTWNLSLPLDTTIDDYHNNPPPYYTTLGTMSLTGSSPGVSWNSPTGNIYTGQTNATELFLTDSTFNTSQIVSSSPYVLNDQSGVLFLYHTFGSADDTGVRAQAQASLVSSTSIVAIGRRAALAAASLQTTSSLSLTPRRYRQFAIAASASSQLTATALRKKLLASHINTVATMPPVPGRLIRLAQASLQVSASLSQPLISRTKQFSVAITALAFEQTTINKIGKGLIHADLVASLASSPTRTARTDIDCQVNSQLACNFIVAKVANAELTVTTEQTTVPKKTTGYQAELTAITTVDADVTKVIVASGLLTSSFTQIANPFYLYSDSIVISSQFTSQANAVKTTGINLGLTAFASELTLGDKLRYFEAHLTAFNTTLVIARIFTVDPFYLIKIPSETKQLYVVPETRQLEVASERRGLVIRSESRLLAINEETRVNIIKGYPL